MNFDENVWSFGKIIHSKLSKEFYYKAHIRNFDALNSDTPTLRIQYEYTQKQCVGVAIEDIDIWYMGIIFYIM